MNWDRASYCGGQRVQMHSMDIAAVHMIECLACCDVSLAVVAVLESVVAALVDLLSDLDTVAGPAAVVVVVFVACADIPEMLLEPFGRHFENLDMCSNDLPLLFTWVVEYSDGVARVTFRESTIRYGL